MTCMVETCFFAGQKKCTDGARGDAASTRRSIETLDIQLHVARPTLQLFKVGMYRVALKDSRTGRGGKS